MGYARGTETCHGEQVFETILSFMTKFQTNQSTNPDGCMHYRIKRSMHARRHTEPPKVTTWSSSTKIHLQLLKVGPTCYRQTASQVSVRTLSAASH